jgi:hypothetical protein
MTFFFGWSAFDIESPRRARVADRLFRRWQRSERTNALGIRATQVSDQRRADQFGAFGIVSLELAEVFEVSGETLG